MEAYYGNDYYAYDTDTEDHESNSGSEVEDNIDPVDHNANVERTENESCEDYGKAVAQFYEVLTTEEINLCKADCIKEVNSVVQLPATITLFLLIHFRWDNIQLIERFYEVDQDTLFAEAGITNPMEELNKAVLPKDNEQNECGICFEMELNSSSMTGLECEHRFCKDCWCVYLTTKIMEEGVGETIACAAHGCDILVDEASVMRLVSDPRVRRKYQFLSANSFVISNRLLRWCPSADCSYAIKLHRVGESMQRVTCKCGHAFCFSCGEDWHEPLTCSMLKKWIVRSQEDSQTSSWIATHTKECPRCSATIEKNGGCNYIQCHSCQFGFCWNCFGELKDQHYHTCQPPPVAAIRGDFSLAERTESAMQKYLFYCKRFMAHKDSLKLEHELYESARQRMKDLQRDGKSWMQVQYLKQAVDVLCQCRQTLMYTYGFAFYLQKNNQSIIFESNQKDLENATEKLSEYLEQEIQSPEGYETKRKVQSKVEYCEARRKVLLEHVREGYEENSWDLSSDYDN